MTKDSLLRLARTTVTRFGRSNATRPGLTISALGITQIFGFGSTYYLPAVLAKPIAGDTGWPLAWIVGGVSVGLLCAGLVSPRVGALIQRHGGRPVLSASSIILAAGLAILAIAPSLPVFLLGWLVIGLGMGSGLYDAAFATLGGLFGRDARAAITSVTLWGGFASTVCWPLSAWMVDHVGWRGACGVYALIQIAISLPLHAILVPGAAHGAGSGAARASLAGDATMPETPTSTPMLARENLFAFAALAALLTIGSIVASTLSMHLLTLLQLRGMDLAAAVGVGVLLGPSQVGARLVEMTFGRRYHAIWTMVASVVLVTVGVGSLAAGWPGAALALCLFGAGNGIGSIARGTLPLALFGPEHYARIMGRLALPSLLAQAVSPFLASVLLDHGMAVPLLNILAGCAALNLLLRLALWRASAPARQASPSGEPA